jgi:hypothetical protein
VTSEREAGMHQRQQQAEAKAQREAQTGAPEAITAELAEFRKHVVRSIDNARGETRADHERRTKLEEQLNRSGRLIECIASSPTARGRSIPPDLRMRLKP